MYDQSWPHQDDPQYFSTTYNNDKNHGYNNDLNQLWLSIPRIHHTRGLYIIKKTGTKYLNDIQKRYRSVVVSLIYLVKNARPGLSNMLVNDS